MSQQGGHVGVGVSDDSGGGVSYGWSLGGADAEAELRSWLIPEFTNPSKDR